MPVGIIRSSHSATPSETWTAYEGFAEHPQLQDIAAMIRSSNPTTAEGKVEFAKFNDDLKRRQVESEKLINLGGAALPRSEAAGDLRRLEGCVAHVIGQLLLVAGGKVEATLFHRPSVSCACSHEFLASAGWFAFSA